MKVIRRDPDAAAQVAKATAEAARAQIRDARRAAFADEADPLAFKVLRGEAKQADYEAKVAEIRARFPYPQE